MATTATIDPDDDPALPAVSFRFDGALGEPVVIVSEAILIPSHASRPLRRPVGKAASTSLAALSSPERAHLSERRHDIIEASAIAFAWRTSGSRSPVPADFLMLEQRSDCRSLATVSQLVDFQVDRRAAGARDIEMQENIGCKPNLIRPGHRASW